MNIKRLRKKYLKAQDKANRLRDKILNEYVKAYIDNDKRIIKDTLNSFYGTYNYKDTDSIIYSDFNKKQEV